MKFSHLHVHTQYSLLDGAAPVSKLYKKAIADGMPALAISDHGNMFGVFDFVAQAYKNTGADGKPLVKPIVGCEFYITLDRNRKVFTKEEKDPRCHQILLAKNAEGYKNLIKLTSLGYIEGMYSKYPRIDKELVLRHHKGLIATTCCLGAMVPQAIMYKTEEEAEKEFKWWLNLFGEDYYVELQRHGMPEQDKVNAILIKFARKHGVKIIASNDSHYVDVEDFTPHDILLCLNTGEKLATPANRGEFGDDDLSKKGMRFGFPNDQFYFKSTAEMSKVFADLPEAIDNTGEIVDKVELLKLKRDIMLPNFPIPVEFQVHGDDVLNQWEYLKHLTYEGARARYSEITEEIRERIDFELFTIKSMGFAGYFLIVSDFIKAGRDMGVFVGPGRGSAAGSVVAYCIGITNIDPIKYKLLFERFLNPDRKSMPDIDTDFDDEGRQKVIDYVVQKYTKSQVAQIVTYGTMAAKSSIKDVARVMDLPLAESNALAKLVAEKPGTKLYRLLHDPLTSQEAKDKDGNVLSNDYSQDDVENARQLREIYATKSLQSEVLHFAERLEGSVRNTGIHAAGIIIAPTDLTELIPVFTSKDTDLLITQIDGSIIEDAGVIKMDFLGLKTLSILRDALIGIRQRHGVEIDLDNLPLDDAPTYALYQTAETIATFQFESPGMQKYLKELKPDQFADLIAMNALYRPGPMAYIPQYVDRKWGREAVEYDLPEMEEYLAETYGITVYQEQVMLLAQKIGGFSKGDADVLRKAMGKKDRKTLDKMKSTFIEGAGKKGFAPKTLEKIWTDWEAFAQYAFNKSHATCYALVAYQTMYLKAHYPAEYMSAVLNHAGNTEKLTFFMDECKRMGIRVLGPDINESQKGFAPNEKGEIRFGLGGLNGVGEAAVESLIAERGRNGVYTDPANFIKRQNLRSVNKRTFENLIYAGALDLFPQYHRAQYICTPEGERVNGLEKLVKYAQIVQSEETNSANTLFGDLPAVLDIQPPTLLPCPEWTLTEKLKHEKEVTGIYISGHPLDHYRFETDHYAIMPIARFNELKEDAAAQPGAGNIRLLCLVSIANHRLSKKGNKFGAFTLEDFTGKTEVVLFGDDYLKWQTLLSADQSIMVCGAFRQRMYGDEWEFKVTSVLLAENVKKQLTKSLLLTLDVRSLDAEAAAFLIANIKANGGSAQVKFCLEDGKAGHKAQLSTLANGVELNDDLIHYLREHTEIGVVVGLN